VILAFTFGSIHWLAAIALVIELAGIGAAVHALMSVRSERGTIAWCLALVLFPWVTLPFYLVFGRTKFLSYRQTLRKIQLEHELEIQAIRDGVAVFREDFDTVPSSPQAVLDKLSPYWFTSGNTTQLLVDGQETFDAVFEAIDGATTYVLVQFYIIRDDRIGQRLKERLISATERDVRVYLLYDNYGTRGLSGEYLAELRVAGIEIAGFGTGRKLLQRIEINFRNHRKLVLADGKVALLGGLNVGDEYMGESAWAGPWRDTHLRIEGPGVIDCQLAFTGDWYWATKTIPVLDWVAQAACGNCAPLLVLPSGPTQEIEICGLAFQTLIASTRERCWIASPYFVPNEAIVAALKFAALRGVDVRIMIPEKRDHWLVYLAAFSFLEEMEAAGVKMLKYQHGFMHQKTFLMDDRFAGVGTANVDQRSFALNFEITAIASGGQLVADVERMFLADWEDCRPAPGSDYRARNFLFKVAVRLARLFDPIL
jgi:cardiolipin synthase